MRARDLRRESRDVWRPDGADPHVELAAPVLGSQRLLLEIEGVDGPVTALLRSTDSRADGSPVAPSGEPSPRIVVAIDFGRAPDLCRRLRVEAGPGGLRLRLRRFLRHAALGAAFGAAVAAGAAPVLVGGDPRLPLQRLLRPVPRLGVPRAAGAPRPDRRLNAWLQAAWAAADGLGPSAAWLAGRPGPRLSLIAAVSDAGPARLGALRASVRAQLPGAVELILADDRVGGGRAWPEALAPGPDLQVVRAAPPGGTAAAVNAALAVARGDWVGLMDQDDLLAPNAAAMVLRALEAAPGTAFLFTDEAAVDGALRVTGLSLKPGFDPVLLSGMNYVGRLAVFRRDRLSALGGMRAGFDGAEDYELALRYCRGLPAGRIIHLPYPACVRRPPAGARPPAQGQAAARRALAEHFGAPDAPAEVAAVEVAAVGGPPDLRRTTPPARRAEPRISVVIPNRDSPALMATVLRGLETMTDWPDLETIVVDNGSTDPATLALYAARAGRAGFRVEHRPGPFNFSAQVNRGVELATGAHVLLLNNDVEMLEPGWLREMAACLRFPGTGVVGARLLFPDGRLQHAGVILGMGGLAGHWHYKAPADSAGPMGRLAVRGGLTVVTGACMLISGACLAAVGPFDAERFAVAYNDVDFCARAREAGFGVVWTPFATLKHHESATRGSDRQRRHAARYARECAALRARHGTAQVEDPAINPWWVRSASRPRLRLRLPPPMGRSFMGMPPVE